MLWLDVISNSTRCASFCDMAAPAVSPALSNIVSACSTSMRYATHMDESCRSYGCMMCWASLWDMAALAVSLALSTADFVMQHVNELCSTYEWITSHVWMRHATLLNETCHTCEWVKSLILMSHVLRFFFGMAAPAVLRALSTPEIVVRHVNVLYNTCEGVKLYIWHATHMNESCHSYRWVICWASFLRHGYSWCFACLV